MKVSQAIQYWTGYHKIHSKHKSRGQIKGSSLLLTHLDG